MWLILGLWAFVTALATWRWSQSTPTWHATIPDDIPVYMRAPSQGYPSYYNTTGTRGAVACELDVCSNVGAYILEKGGSAADAVCTQIRINVR